MIETVGCAQHRFCHLGLVLWVCLGFGASDFGFRTRRLGMRQVVRLNSLLLAGLFFGVALADACAQAPAKASAGAELATFTTQEDHRQMMQQLGITALRPGPSGNESAPNHANYDESLANPFPNLPEVLTLKNGLKVTSADVWWKQRRPEIVEDFEREVVGRVPIRVP